VQHRLRDLAFDAELDCAATCRVLHRNGADERDVVALVDHLLDMIGQELPLRVEVGASLQMPPLSVEIVCRKCPVRC
jgi:hypothetical protein